MRFLKISLFLISMLVISVSIYTIFFDSSGSTVYLASPLIALLLIIIISIIAKKKKVMN